jgi:hypothetical protein
LGSDGRATRSLSSDSWSPSSMSEDSEVTGYVCDKTCTVRKVKTGPGSCGIASICPEVNCLVSSFIIHLLDDSNVWPTRIKAVSGLDSSGTFMNDERGS